MRALYAGIAVCLLSWSGLAQQDLLPELAGEAGKYKAKVAELERLRGAAVAQAARPYVSALDGIEKAATARGEVAVVAAAVKEREAARAGALEESLSDALPKARLQSARKALQAALKRVAKESAGRRKQADAEYLRALAALQAKAASNPELAQQVAAEKAALLAGAAGAASAEAGGGAEKGKAPRGKNVVVNGDFEKVGEDGKPEGWFVNGGVIWEKENENVFVRFPMKHIIYDGTERFRSVRQSVNCPENAKVVSLSARLRTENCSVSPSKKKPNVPSAVISFKGKDGKIVSYTSVYWDGRNNVWRTLQRDEAVPKDTAEIQVEVLDGHCSGQIDFDDIEVTFR